MARISIKGMIAFILIALGAWLIVQALSPMVSSVVGGQWYIMFAAGIILVVIAGLFGRRGL